MNQERLEELRTWASEHNLRYEVHPAEAMVNGERLAIGYDVELYATHGRHADEHGGLLPGCPKCSAVWMALEDIARAAMPPPDGTTEIGVRPFDRGLHYPNDVPRVELTIEIRHVGDRISSLDADERRCLLTLVAGLQRVGTSGV